MSACTLTPRVTALSSARCSSLRLKRKIVMSICLVAFLMAATSGTTPSLGSIINSMRSSGSLFLFGFPFDACARVRVERDDFSRDAVGLQIHRQLDEEGEFLR